MAPEAGSDLKQLNFVQEKGGQAINYTSNVAGKVYSTTKEYIPQQFHPHVKSVEDKVSEYGSPVLTTVQDKGGNALQFADSKVLLFYSKGCWCCFLQCICCINSTGGGSAPSSV